MNFEQKLSDFVLGNRTISQHPDIALTGMREQLESESLFILAGMNESDNTFELEQYFQKMIIELQIELPTKAKAANALLNYYLTLMISEPKQAFELMTKIHNEIYQSSEWPQTDNEDISRYLGSELGLEHLYTWYRELQDFKDGGMLLYFNDLSKTEQYQKFMENLITEAEKWLKTNKTHITQR